MLLTTCGGRTSGRRTLKLKTDAGMIPAALRAHFHHVAGKVAFASANAVKVLNGQHANAARRQARPEHVSHQNQNAVAAKRASIVGWLAVRACRSQKFGMCIANALTSDTPAPRRRNGGITHQPIVDCGCAEPSKIRNKVAHAQYRNRNRPKSVATAHHAIL